MKFLSVVILLLLVLTFSCKKPAEVEPPNLGNTVIIETQQKIRHTWNFIHSVLNDYGTNPGSDTILGLSGDYYIFHSNNIAYSYWNNVNDTVSYKILDADIMLYGGDTMQISTLNATEFEFKKVILTDTTHYENVIRLAR